MTAPYWEDDTVQLYLGDMREVLPALGITADLVLADPPYEETEQEWDQWQDGWLDVAAQITRSMWCFGSMRMFFEHLTEFTAQWKPSQDVIWEKTCPTSMRADRFARIHESAVHWYHGKWADLYIDPQREKHYGPDKGTKRNPGDRFAHWGRRSGDSVNRDDGKRLVRSVLRAPNLRGRGIHPNQKPVGVLTPLIEYACLPGGLVVDPFAGSGSTLEAARLTGRKAIGIERHEPYAEAAAKRLAQAPLEIA